MELLDEFAAGRIHLCLPTRRPVSLCDGSELRNGRGPTTAIIINLQRCYQRFQQLTKGQAVFTIAQAAQCAGMSRQAIDEWCRQGIIQTNLPDEAGRGGPQRRFSPGDCFIAAVAGLCSRNGVNKKQIRRVAEFLRQKMQPSETTETEATEAATNEPTI